MSFSGFGCPQGRGADNARFDFIMTIFNDSDTRTTGNNDNHNTNNENSNGDTLHYEDGNFLPSVYRAASSIVS